MKYPEPYDEKHFKFLSPRDFYYHECTDMIDWDEHNKENKVELTLLLIAFFVMLTLGLLYFS